MKIPEIGEIRKPSKTLAGVTPIAVMCCPRKCKHGTCVYCPSLDVPQSYTPKSPPVLRAEVLGYDAYEQVKSRLKAFDLMNHPISKIEIIIMGGNFLDYPKNYQYEFVKSIYEALNHGLRKGRKSGSLERAKKKNEKAKHRCVALCIESRPDTILKKGVVKRLLEFGCTRVEIGVQCLDDKIYKRVNRGHGIREVVEASQKLRDSGFKIGYHMMLGLPGMDFKKDVKMFKTLFSDNRFKPDQLKIYPTQVLEGAVLGKWYKRGRYKPYTEKQLLRLIVRIMKIIPNYCRVMRVMREIPPEYLIAGTTRIDLRREIENSLRKENAKINEIRFREIGFALRDLKKGERVDNNLGLKVSKYSASEGEEYFLEFVNTEQKLNSIIYGGSSKLLNFSSVSQSINKSQILCDKNNILFGLLRLRIINGKGFVRELHVYGQALAIGEKKKGIQHSGLGKQLMKKAEEICLSEGVSKLFVISGVGVREYYRKLGYKLEGEYMVKTFKKF
jgi:elongator complex protein 3